MLRPISPAPPLGGESELLLGDGGLGKITPNVNSKHYP
jgi:hypothetical protein